MAGIASQYWIIPFGPAWRGISWMPLLGKWHDFQVIIRHLKKAMDTCGINPKEVSQLEKTKAKFSSDSELLFNKINVAIPTSEFFAVHIK